jgi:RNA polymerase sigma factor (sigma-70 family)
MASSHPVVSHPYAATLIRIKAKQLCRRTDFTRCQVEDLQQSMWAYLVEKATLYDPDRGNIEAFITNLINTWVAMELRHRGREKRRLAHRNISLDSTMIEHDGDRVPMGSVLGETDLLRRLGRAPGSESDRFEIREAIAQAIKKLSPDQQALLADVVESGVASAAKHRDISPSTVRRRLSEMRDIFGDAGLGPEGR